MKSFRLDRKASSEELNWFRKHKILTVMLILIALAIIGAAIGGTNQNDNINQQASTPSPSSNSTTSDTRTSSTPKIGQPARDGKFEFVVKSIECGRPNVGSDFLTETAQGQYCLLNVTVKNIGNEPQSLFSSNQYLFNAQGQKYSADDAATYAASPQGNTWYEEINPGNSVEGAIVFDIPKDQTPTTAELHDSAFSGGVKVSLR